VITAADLGLEELSLAGEGQKLSTLKEARDMAEKNVVHQALVFCRNNISQAAKLLDISRPTLHDLSNKHGINAS